MDTEFELQDQQEKLAHAFIQEYLHGQGYSFDAFGILPPARVKALMIQASIYASVKLAEIEDRAQMVTSLHHATESLT